jgi:hypothetical protein
VCGLLLLILEELMQLALRPYVTTGVAIVGASVIAVAPIVPTPTEIQIPNPVTQLERGVQLTANEIEDAVNQVIFAVTQVGVRIATLPAPIVAQLLDVPEEVAQALLAGAALGLSGPLIGGGGALGAALQDIVDELGGGDIAGLINALIGAPATLIGGFVNGGYGPNVSTLVGLPEIINVLVGGLINPGGLGLGGITLPGAIPTLQALVEQILGALGGGGVMAAAVAPLAAPVATEGQIEAAVNALLFTLVATPIVTVSGFLGSLLEPLIGEEAAAALPIAALGLFGPLISGPGAIGAAVQDVVDSLGSGDFAGILSALIGGPATVIGGFVNGGYGPNLQELLPDLPTVLPGPLPITKVLAGGLIPNPGYSYPALLQGLGLTVGLTGGTLLLPGVFPTLQSLVTRVFDSLPGLGALSAAAPAASTLSIASTDTDTSDKKLVTLDVAPDVDDTGGKHAAPVTTLAAPDLPSEAKVPPKVDEIKAAIDTEKGPETGTKVSEAAKPDTDTLDMTNGGKVIPETTVSDGEGGSTKKGGSNPVGSAISSVTKSLAGAVKSALGG